MSSSSSSDSTLSLFPPRPERDSLKEQKPRPFLKWAGGKGQLLEHLLPIVKKAGPFKRYLEPFAGGGALYFATFRTGLLAGRPALLSDTNPNLMEVYEAVKGPVDELIALLTAHKAQHSEDYYYEVRRQVPSSPVERAARVIYLNKTCFNGLYRENKSGGFNVPYGRYARPSILDEPNLRACHEALAATGLEVRSYEDLLSRVQPGDFVYLDPPYDIVSGISSFTSYAKDGFGVEDQEKLSDIFGELSKRKVKALLSNSRSPRIEHLYRAHYIDIVKATRYVNAKGDGRGAVEEVLVRNF